MNRRLLAMGLLAFTGGASLGYVVAWKRLEGKYAAIAEEEIKQARAFYSVLHKKDELSDPQALVEAQELIEEKLGTVEIIQDQGYGIVAEVTEGKVLFVPDDEPIPTVQNVFDRALEDEENWIWEEELKNRGDTNPYVITYEEFHQNEENYQQLTFTYFEGDDILCDDGNEIVADVDSVVGDANLKRFGHASRDNNIVFIRNPRLEMEMEVVKTPHEYTRDVLGFIEHSYEPRRRRFRSDDE